MYVVRTVRWVVSVLAVSSFLSMRDAPAAKMYWIAVGLGDAFDPKIQRANLDGTIIEDLVTWPVNANVFPNYIALDPAGGKMYWTLGDLSFDSPSRIQRANLDGSNIEDLVFPADPENEEFKGLALDLDAGKMYWANRQAKKIQRANLDGTNIEDAIGPLPNLPNGDQQVPFDIALDTVGGKIYWTQSSNHSVHRANLDGSNSEKLLSVISFPRAVTLDVPGNRMYWSNIRDGIEQSALDGTNRQSVFTFTPRLGVNDIRQMGLDVSGGQIYWSDAGPDGGDIDRILRVNLDGSNVEDLVIGVANPIGFALDLSEDNLAAPPSSLDIALNVVGGLPPGPNPLPALEQAAGIWESVFKDRARVRIDVQFSPLSANTLAEAKSTTVGLPYSALRQTLADDQTSIDDAVAVSHLQPGRALDFLTTDENGNTKRDNDPFRPFLQTLDSYASQDVEINNSMIDLDRASAKALGLLGDDGKADAVITFNSDAVFDYDRTDGIEFAAYDFIGVAAHELAHALGFGSGVDELDSVVPPNGPGSASGGVLDLLRMITPLDLFRYTDESAVEGIFAFVVAGNPFFSIDGGATILGGFSSGAHNGDGNSASHWQDSLDLGILDPSTMLGQLLEISELDLRAMDVIGWDRLADVSLSGDFNEDGKVDAADYVTWRKNESAGSALPNDDGLATQADRFTLWRANFGNMTMPAFSSGSGQVAAPEPTSAMLMALAVLTFTRVLSHRTRQNILR